MASIASGSNGNCYYVGNEHEAVLIDAGISCREIARRMSRLQLSMHRVKAIFISHEHSDHIRGLYSLARKFDLPVYVTEQTLRYSSVTLPISQTRIFAANQTTNLGRLKITSFIKEHDAVEPHSFVVSQDDINIGVFTDIGRPCESLRYHFNRCHAAFLESNYDEDMLLRGRYPVYLKRRISGGQGHLSNKQAMQLFLNYKPAHMSHLILAHLSGENNTPQLVESMFTGVAGNTRIVVASRHQESEVFTITANPVSDGTSPSVMSQQMSLF